MRRRRWYLSFPLCWLSQTCVQTTLAKVVGVRSRMAAVRVTIAYSDNFGKPGLNFYMGNLQCLEWESVIVTLMPILKTVNKTANLCGDNELPSRVVLPAALPPVIFLSARLARWHLAECIRRIQMYKLCRHRHLYSEVHICLYIEVAWMNLHGDGIPATSYWEICAS